MRRYLPARPAAARTAELARWPFDELFRPLSLDLERELGFDLDGWLTSVEQELWGGRLAAAKERPQWTETDDAHELTLSLPEGLGPRDLSVVVEDRRVEVRGACKPRRGIIQRVRELWKSKPRRRPRGKRSVSFRSIATLPPTADPSRVEARWRDGALVVRALKKPEACARRIQVRAA